ncbi:hypothetical protein FGIG_11914 [Fasciola gigantica]|uniref:CUB domain-containing protein n=1 Tax=Fasciola gigantica TaxID=46835 RepID=A0A504YTZ5_FASGI|nr:hypothetical protein FGIG_11914 [Fasciola gigantica]
MFIEKHTTVSTVNLVELFARSTFTHSYPQSTSIRSDGRTILKGKTCMPGRGEVLVRSPSETVDMANGEANSGNEAKSKFGIFESPNWSRQTDLEPRCVYRFIADVGEKVHVKFDRFQLSGEMP